MKFKLQWISVLSLVLFVSSTASAAIISGANKAAGNATAINLLSGGLQEGVEAYTDRTHTLVNIPNALEGSDYIQVSNNDKTSDPYQLDVTLNQLSLLYVALDNRVTDGDASTRAQPLSWMSDSAATGLPGPFFDTGASIDIDESADGGIDNSFSLFATLAPAGTYSLLAQNDGGSRNNYVVFASTCVVIPEPSSLALMGLGLLGLCARFRRR